MHRRRDHGSIGANPTRVLARAEQIGQKIIDTYLEPNKTFLELREMVNNKAIDILSGFSEACREEFQSLQVATVGGR